ncbi:hypothetical protein GCM10011328_12440 [Hafnia psychrotolerans]|uniref:Uncharacterized protein n=1 Tax=Hafnia psychrotolerans TaxID=1477018 RepID=A0ABQ1G8Y8_9GAMM|nr:hypothetical protein GCM10011328_12440 [Hafnia psychrotolerans]
MFTIHPASDELKNDGCLYHISLAESVLPHEENRAKNHSATCLWQHNESLCKLAADSAD